jgi:hypothetical protein
VADASRDSSAQLAAQLTAQLTTHLTAELTAQLTAQLTAHQVRYSRTPSTDAEDRARRMRRALMTANADGFCRLLWIHPPVVGQKRTRPSLEPIVAWRGHDCKVTALAAAGRLFVSAAANGSVKVWDAAGGLRACYGVTQREMARRNAVFGLGGAVTNVRCRARRSARADVCRDLPSSAVICRDPP